MVVTKNLDAYIVESLEREKDLRPLLLFRGQATEHRARTMFALIRLLRDNDVPTPPDAVSLLEALPDERHRSGLHAKTLPSMSLTRWIARLKQAPAVFDIDRNLREYVEWVWNSIPPRSRFLLAPISATAYRSRRAWRLVQKALGEPTQLYPFITKDRTADNAILAAVHSAVPKYLAEDIRADVCQDLIVSILTGEVSLDNLSEIVPQHLKAHRDMYGDRWANVKGAKLISLNAPMYAHENGGWLTVEETLKD